MAAPDLLVVAEPGDGGARAVCRLASAGLGPTSTSIALLTPAQLTAARWSHQVDQDGGCRTVVVGGTDTRSVAGRGWRLDSDRLRLVWFRGRSWRPRGVADADADYAEAEWTALLVSWLAALGDRVVNRVDGVSPVGPSWSPARWLAAAGEAGLPVARRTAATSARLVDGWRGSPWDARRPFDGHRAGAVTGVLVLDGVPVGGSAAFDPRGCRALAAAAGCRVLRVETDAEGAVVGVDPCPPLICAEQAAATAALLTARLTARLTAPSGEERAA